MPICYEPLSFALRLHPCIFACTTSKGMGARGLFHRVLSGQCIVLIHQPKRKTSYAKRSSKTKQHTTPDELESHNPMPTNHVDTPGTGEPLRPHIHCNIELKPDCAHAHGHSRQDGSGFSPLCPWSLYNRAQRTPSMSHTSSQHSLCQHGTTHTTSSNYNAAGSAPRWQQCTNQSNTRLPLAGTICYFMSCILATPALPACTALNTAYYYYISWYAIAEKVP